MEEALGADGHGFLEQHDALIGLVAEEVQGGGAARRRHVEMLPAARGYDKAFCCVHAGVPLRGPRSRDIRCQTRTLAAPGAAATVPSFKGSPTSSGSIPPTRGGPRWSRWAISAVCSISR